MDTHICRDKDLKRLYHEIIIQEARLLSRFEDRSDTPSFAFQDKHIHALGKIDYGLKIYELEDIAERLGLKNTCVDELIKQGFLIPLRNNDGEYLYRSFHMDILVRASDIRIMPGGGKIILQSSFIVGQHVIDDFSQALLFPRIDGVEEEKEFYELLYKTLGEKLVRIYIDVLKGYLDSRGARGLTYFQLSALKEMIASFTRKNVFVITAPAGSGKTEVFLFSILYKLLLDLKNNRRSKIFVVYPRKFLEIDQSERVISLLKKLNEKLNQFFVNREFTIALRDGDTATLEEEVETARKEGRREVEFRGIKCGHKGILVIQLDKSPIVACKEDTAGGYTPYSFVKWNRESSKEADIVITNLYTLYFRVVDKSPEDLNVHDIMGDMPLDTIVLDEVHEYTPAELGLLYYTFKVINFIRSTMNLQPLKVVLSSATVSNPSELARRLTDEDPLLLDYGTILKSDEHKIRQLEESGKIGLTKKLVILGILTVNPNYSWETYVSQLAITLLFVNKSLDLLGRGVKQSIIFLNNVKELNRVHAVIENDLQLGSPLDNAGLRGSWNQELDPTKYRYSIRHYTDLLKMSQKVSKEISDFLASAEGNKHVKESLFPRLAKIYSGTPLEERLTIAKKIHDKTIYVIMATSSLELGVDYPGVTVVANMGFSDKLPSIIQRFGRAGRKLSDTLNTTLALLIVRNNPLEYVRLFEALKSNMVTLMVEGSITPAVAEKLDKNANREISIEVARDLDAVRRLGVLRALLTMSALDGKLSGLEPVKDETDECEILANLRKQIEEYREQLAKLFDQAENVIKSILEHELGFENVETCNQHYKTLRKLDICVDFLEERTKKLSAFTDRFKSMLQAIPSDKNNKELKRLENWLKETSTLQKKYFETLNAHHNNLKPPLNVEEFIMKVNNLEEGLKKICEDISNHYLLTLSDLIRGRIMKREVAIQFDDFLRDFCKNNIERIQNPCKKGA